mmetsp:Transcript_2419/g.5021  ORF Transcript_2419/g.5021 Transcript_2419/m.5021 type:complete len:215 (-) Transcript_2419:58-702(-)
MQAPWPEHFSPIPMLLSPFGQEVLWQALPSKPALHLQTPVALSQKPNPLHSTPSAWAVCVAEGTSAQAFPAGQILRVQAFPVKPLWHLHSCPNLSTRPSCFAPTHCPCPEHPAGQPPPYTVQAFFTPGSASHTDNSIEDRRSAEHTGSKTRETFETLQFNPASIVFFSSSSSPLPSPSGSVDLDGGWIGGILNLSLATPPPRTENSPRTKDCIS